MNIKFHDLKTQYTEYKEELHQAIQEVLASSQFIMGEAVHEFEKELALYLNCPHLLTCSSGTDALLLSMMALELKPGDEVMTTPFTFIAAGEMIRLLGLKPVFVDIDPRTYNIDPLKMEEKFTKKTRAIIPVSLYGQPADMDEINALSCHYANHYQHPINVIEDAAQSLGAVYKNKKSSNLSDIGCLSFFPTKPLGCYGDGGAIVVQDEVLAQKIKSLRIHGQTKRYYHEYIGMNGRLDTIQAAVLRVKLKYLDREILKRQIIAKNYEKLLCDLNLRLPFVKPDRTCVYAQYSISTTKREMIMKHFKNKDIPLAIHYPQPLHLQPCFKDLGYKKGDFPIAEQVSQEVLSLPMSAFLTLEQQNYIAFNLKEALSQSKVAA